MAYGARQCSSCTMALAFGSGNRLRQRTLTSLFGFFLRVFFGSFPPFFCNPGSDAGDKNLAEVIATYPSLSSMAGNVVTGDAFETLGGTQSITVFALHNDALEAVESIIGGLSPEGVRNMLLAHVAFDAATTSSELYDGMEIKAGLGGTSMLYVRKDGSNWKIENADGTSSAKVIFTDLVATNGVAHIIDTVIMPPSAAPTPAPTPAFADLIDAAFINTDVPEPVVSEVVLISPSHTRIHSMCWHH